MFSTIEWTDDGVVMLDQRRLPEQEIYLTLRSAEEVAAAIRDMAIRGAPAIGVAAAMGIALGIGRAGGAGVGGRRAPLESGAPLLGSTPAPAADPVLGVDREPRPFA